MKYIFRLTLLYHYLQLFKSTSSKYRKMQRIIGGELALVEDYSFVACLVKKSRYSWDDFRGGAAIISRYWALTAAHCMEYITDFDIGKGVAFVRSNSSHWRKNYIGHVIVKRVIHENFNEKILDCDIAMVKVGNAFDGLYERPIPLTSMNRRRFTGTVATALGWGSTDPATFTISDDLRQVNLYLAKHDGCKHQYRPSPNNTRIVTSRMICAGAPDKDTCIYDSGGPLIQDGVLIGIVSWGPEPCAHRSLPGVYTRIASFVTWIRSQMLYSQSVIRYYRI